MVAHDRGHLSARRLDGMDAAAQAADRKAFVGKTEKRLRRKAAKNEDRLRLENFKLPAFLLLNTLSPLKMFPKS